MSFDKEYPNRKDWREQYYGPKRDHHSCRNHGSCNFCQRGKKRESRKAEISMREQLTERE